MRIEVYHRALGADRVVAPGCRRGIPGAAAALTPCIEAGYNPGKLTRREGALEPDQVARVAVEVATDKQAQDIVLLDIHELTTIADYFVIMSAPSARQLEALREEIVIELKKSGVTPHHTEGTAKGGWVLIDYSDVIIHLFGEEERGLYALDRLWAGAAQVVRVL